MTLPPLGAGRNSKVAERNPKPRRAKPISVATHEDAGTYRTYIDTNRGLDRKQLKAQSFFRCWIDCSATRFSRSNPSMVGVHTLMHGFGHKGRTQLLTKNAVSTRGRTVVFQNFFRNSSMKAPAGAAHARPSAALAGEYCRWAVERTRADVYTPLLSALRDGSKGRPNHGQGLGPGIDDPEPSEVYRKAALPTAARLRNRTGNCLEFTLHLIKFII